MQFTLKIERYDPDTDEGRLQEFTVDAPETSTLLDVLDVVKDTVDGSVTYRKSCRMAVCGSCGMRMDGAAVLACKTRMQTIAESGHVPVISAGAKASNWTKNRSRVFSANASSALFKAIIGQP